MQAGHWIDLTAVYLRDSPILLYFLIGLAAHAGLILPPMRD